MVIVTRVSKEKERESERAGELRECCSTILTSLCNDHVNFAAATQKNTNGSADTNTYAYMMYVCVCVCDYLAPMPQRTSIMSVPGCIFFFFCVTLK